MFDLMDTPSVKLGKSLGDSISAIAVHPSGLHLAVVCSDVLHFVAWPSLKKLAVAKEPASSIQFAPDGATLVSSHGRSLAFRDPATGAVLRRTPDNPNPLWDLAISPDGKRVVVGGYEHAIIYDFESAKELLRFPVFRRIVPRVTWSSDGSRIAARMCEDVGVFDARTGALVQQLSGIVAERAVVAFASDGALVTSIDETTLGIFTREDGSRPSMRLPAAGLVQAIAVSAQAIAYGDGSSVRVVGRDGSTLAKLDEHRALVTALAFTHDGGLLAGARPALWAWRKVDSAEKSTSTKGRPAKRTVSEPIIDVVVAGAREVKRDAALENVAWLSKLGKKLPATADVKQLASLEDWPGTDSPGVAAFIELLGSVLEDVEAAARVSKVRLDPKAYDRVFDRAVKSVPHDDEADWAVPGNMAPHVVATLAQIVSGYRALGWSLHPTLATAWAWCSDGRWPAGFARKPGKKPVQLLVL